jgi:drug/metabolite transporter (DMT)-like permease
MTTHATMPTRRRVPARTPVRRPRSALAWAVPVALGVILGFWAFFIKRDGGATTGGQIWLGVVSGAAFAALCYAFVRVRWALPRELRAAAFGVLTGGAVGFLSSLNGKSVLTSSAIGLVVGAGTLCTMFYAYYTREN